MNKTEKPKVQKAKRVKPLVKSEFTELAKVDKTYNSGQLDFIKKTLAPTLNDDELRLFIYRAQKLGLNPLNGEISAHAREGKHGRQLVVIIGKDGKARKAMQTGLVESVFVEAIYTKEVETPMYAAITDKDGNRDLEPVEGSSVKNTIRVKPWEGGTLWGAIATVKRKGIERNFEVILPISEYQTGQLYGQLKSTMIKKTALSQAYTMAFPDLFSGVYVEEELPTILNESNAPEPLKDGGEPASEAQLAAIKSLDTDNEEFGEDGKQKRPLTKQEAAVLIKELAQKKGKK